jgi:hypothetical protein
MGNLPLAGILFGGRLCAVWNHSVFSKNRDRLIEHDAVTELFNATVDMADRRGTPRCATHDTGDEPAQRATIMSSGVTT